MKPLVSSDGERPQASALLGGRVALVTGAAQGLGRGIATGLAQAGASLCIVDIDAEELANTTTELRSAGVEPIVVCGDVRDAATLEHAVAQMLARWGHIDLLVSNAAVLPLIRFEQTTPDIWQRTLDINLSGVFNGVRAVWEPMKRQGGGWCVAIASGSSTRGYPKEVAYCATKHALEGFTKALAIEAAPFGIGVCTMEPGKLIKPTSLTRADVRTVSAEEQATWIDPVMLSPAFVWLAIQTPARCTGLCLDAGLIADTITREGYDFAFSPTKVTTEVADLLQRLADRHRWAQYGGLLSDDSSW